MIEISNMTIEELNSISSALKDFDDFWNYNTLKSQIEGTNSIFVYKDNNEIIGFAAIEIILDVAEISNIVIKKSKRGQGFSKILLEFLINYAKQKKCTKINLEVASNNNIAITLYKSFDFKQVGIRKNYYNNSTNALLFTKNLK